MLGDNTHITFNTYMIQSSIWKPKTKGMLELMYVYHVKIITSLRVLHGRFFSVPISLVKTSYFQQNVL